MRVVSKAAAVSAMDEASSDFQILFHGVAEHFAARDPRRSKALRPRRLAR